MFPSVSEMLRGSPQPPARPRAEGDGVGTVRTFDRRGYRLSALKMLFWFASGCDQLAGARLHSLASRMFSAGAMDSAVVAEGARKPAGAAQLCWHPGLPPAAFSPKVWRPVSSALQQWPWMQLLRYLEEPRRRSRHSQTTLTSLSQVYFQPYCMLSHTARHRCSKQQSGRKHSPHLATSLSPPTHTGDVYTISGHSKG